MTQVTPTENLKFFIGHKEPEFPIWSDYKYFGPENLSVEPQGMVEDLLDHQLLNEYAFLFQLRRRLKSAINSAQLVTLCQYRRFLVRESLGTPSKSIPWARILKASDVLEMGGNLPSLVGPDAGQDFQIGPLIQVKESIVVQYAKHHHCRDILRFSADLVDANIFTNAEALEFLSQQVFVPTPSCGTFPIGFLIWALETIEKAAEVFINNGYQAYADPYQGRVMGFLLERLNSYLLLTYLKSAGIDASALCGRMIIISDELSVKHGLAPRNLRYPGVGT